MARLLAVALATLSAAAVAAPASAKTSWLCLPGAKPDPCSPSLKTTVFSSFSTRTGVVTPKANKPKIDCFYIYPTVSNQSTTVATKARDPEIRDIALFQAARYSQVCRVFAPLYRQITVAGLTHPNITAAQVKVGDRDIAAAWSEYLAKYNHGRGVVL